MVSNLRCQSKNRVRPDTGGYSVILSGNREDAPDGAEGGSVVAAVLVQEERNIAPRDAEIGPEAALAVLMLVAVAGPAEGHRVTVAGL